jgi:hypothetical protein
MTKTKSYQAVRYAYCLDHLNFGHLILPALLNIIGLASDMGFTAE